jgi:hypothetical protein
MDYQPMDQMNNRSSNKTWYVVILVVLIAIFALWYFSGDKAIAPVIETPTESSATDQTQMPALSGGNTTADISTDLSQIPENSTDLNADADASVKDIQGF